MPQSSGVAALIVAAGRGSRAGPSPIPKQYQSIGGRPILVRSLDLFLNHPAIDRAVAVIADDDGELYAGAVPQHIRLESPISGGPTRQDSVRFGLEALAAMAPERVLIHDAARPFASAELISRVVSALDEGEAVVPVLPVGSTLKAVAGGVVTETIPREGLHHAETPQGFRFAAIHSAHQRAAAAGLRFTDDAAVAEWAGIPVRVVAGDIGNVKLTTADDLMAADRRLMAEEALRLGDLRVGTGYDVHSLGPGVEIMLGGVAVPHTRGVVGHSDGDVMLHALTDAVLGALADGDIGVHFPPTDDRWRGAASDQFLADAVARVKARGGVIAHLDVAFVGEGPKVAPYRETIRQRIAAICGITVDRVGVKATTSEGMGFIGRGEGIAATATATIRLPFAKSP